MWKLTIVSSVALYIALTALVGCGPSKPTGSAYLGKWVGTGRDNLDGNRVACQFDVSTVGQSFLIKGEGPGNCSVFGGIFILTPEGNLSRGSGLGELVISYDKDKNQAIVSAGGDVEYWTKAETLNGFVGRWQYGHDGADASGRYEPIGYLSISKTGNGNFQLQDDCVLSIIDGKLECTIRSSNFRATHGAVFEYHIVIERIDENDLLYTVTSDLAPETHKAHRIQ